MCSAALAAVGVIVLPATATATGPAVLAGHRPALAPLTPLALPGQNALTLPGTVHAWGANGQGQLGDGTTTGRLTPI